MTSQDGAGGGMENTNTKGQEPEVQNTVSSQSNVPPKHHAPMHDPRANVLASNSATATPPLSRTSSHRVSSKVVESKPEPSSEPPVTRQTLVELDVNRIVLNSRLRHDINFDPELHFRPNMDGDKGRKKNQKAELYWQLLSEQLTLFMTNRQEFGRRWDASGSWCLPNLLKAVKEIIQTLVPSRDRQSLEECFNLELLMQQFNHGVADLEKLASWLAGLLKSHCAPMRDEWVDDMYNLLSKGNKNNDIKMLVKGLRDLLSVLEAMKLDVANHQIRCLRPSLIEDTVKFERRYFDKKMSADRLDVSSAQAWFRNVDNYAKGFATSSNVEENAAHIRALGDLASVGIGMAQLTMPTMFSFRFPISHNHHHPQATHNGTHGQYTTIPPTFMHDEERIYKFREEISEMTAISLAMMQYDCLALEFPKLQTNVPSYIITSTSSGSTFSSDSDSMDIDEDEVSICHSTGSADSSPRASMVFPTKSSTTTTTTTTTTTMTTTTTTTIPPLLTEQEIRQTVYQSLIDLLRNVPPSSSSRGGLTRWEYVAPMWALQIVRNSSAPLEKTLDVEKSLIRSMQTLTTQDGVQVQMDIFRNLCYEILPRLRDFRGMKAWHLFTNGTSGRPYRPSRGVNNLPLRPEMANLAIMATKIAHVATLHHQVWAPIYAISTDQAAASCSPSSLTSSPAPTPTRAVSPAPTCVSSVPHAGTPPPTTRTLPQPQPLDAAAAAAATVQAMTEQPISEKQHDVTPPNVRANEETREADRGQKDVSMG